MTFFPTREGVLTAILQALQDGQTLTCLATLGTLSRDAGEGLLRSGERYSPTTPHPPLPGSGGSDFR
jgi:hypothetical protein